MLTHALHKQQICRGMGDNSADRTTKCFFYVSYLSRFAVRLNHILPLTPTISQLSLSLCLSLSHSLAQCIIPIAEWYRENRNKLTESFCCAPLRIIAGAGQSAHASTFLYIYRKCSGCIKIRIEAKLNRLPQRIFQVKRVSVIYICVQFSKWNVESVSSPYEVQISKGESAEWFHFPI